MRIYNYRTIVYNNRGDENSKTEQLNQENNNNLREKADPIVKDKMFLLNIQQVSLRDALEVGPMFGGSNIPLSPNYKSQFIQSL